MFSFFKRNKKDGREPVPEWASFFTREEYDRFLILIQDYFNSIDIGIEIGNKVVTVTRGDFKAESMGLTNISRKCKQSEPALWNEIIFDHFDSFRKAAEFDIEFQARVNDFDYARDYISTRLYHKDFLEGPYGKGFIQKPLFEDISSALVFDLPYTIINVKPELVDQWNCRTVDELFELGKENIRKKYQFTVDKEAFGDDFVWLIGGDHPFIPNILFDLENYPELQGSNGSLIGMPNRDVVVIRPMDNLKAVVDGLSGLCYAITGMHDDNPGALSTGLYWYKNGEFELQEYELKEKGMSFTPTDKFLAMMESWASSSDAKTPG